MVGDEEVDITILRAKKRKERNPLEKKRKQTGKEKNEKS